MYIIHDCLPIFEMSISSIVAPISWYSSTTDRTDLWISGPTSCPWLRSCLCSPASRTRPGRARPAPHIPAWTHTLYTREEVPRVPEDCGPYPSGSCLMDQLAVSLYISNVRYNCREADSKRRSAIPVSKLPGWYPAIPWPSLWLSPPNQGSNHQPAPSEPPHHSGPWLAPQSPTVSVQQLSDFDHKQLQHHPHRLHIRLKYWQKF